ncbi:catalase/peroxidase HPI [Rhizosphaericola mali]|uniref:Catalase-peroxidase n=2 Tax=Rhizosphaericola mali TaxID=2545455 RepID=A0A5P2G614_9BACT|nr:catalase/peroxidase HPI [Rhizosphaericola mali]
MSQEQDITKCPFLNGEMDVDATSHGTKSKDWWPNELTLDILRQQSELSDPLDPNFNYAAAFKTLDLKEVKKDIDHVLTDSKSWWPADFGNYGPFFIRMAWHSAGTYRIQDGKGGAGRGQQRFEPLNSWPDNANLDKARRLLWPVKQKYGQKLSWADLIVLAGNVALENMGFKTIGFGGGRADVWEADKDIYWGNEKTWLAHRNPECLANPLAATEMGLIYVNPEGPNKDADPLTAAAAIRKTFGNMGMDDEETVALIAGGHSFGKTHGAADAAHVGPEPAAAGLESQGLGWKSNYATGSGKDAITSGLEVTWTTTPTKFSNGFFHSLFENEWVLTKSPAGALQYVAKDSKLMVPDAFDKSKSHKPTMLTTDLSLRYDSNYAKISRRFLEHPDEFAIAFAKAWFKLTHRDMGPKSRYLGDEVPTEDFIWQDPILKADYKILDSHDVDQLKEKIAASDLTITELVKTAWASASTYRTSDKRGGANGAHIQLAPETNWAVNNPEELNSVLNKLKQIQTEFNHSLSDGKKVSLADLIVIGGSVGIEKAANAAGEKIVVPVTLGRTDALQSETDLHSFSYLEPIADGFRNYVNIKRMNANVEELLVEKAQQLTLTAPEMTVLVGGLRVIGTNYDNSNIGVFTNRKGQLTNDFFVNLLDMQTKWEPKDPVNQYFEGYDLNTGARKWGATRADLVFGSQSELRAIAEVYASSDAQQKFVNDFVKAWVKVMNLDRFDLKK